MCDAEVQTECDERAAANFRQFIERVRPVVVTIQALDASDRSPQGVRFGGTGCLVCTPEARFILTAKHVVDRYQHDGYIGVMGGDAARPVVIKNWPVIDRETTVDLATVAVPDDFEAASLGKQFYRPQVWPPRRAEPGEVAGFIGFIGEHRAAVEDRLLNYFTPIVDFVTSTSERHFVMADEGVERQVVIREPSLHEPGPTGGVSGAPVFLNRGGGLELAGVIYEGGDTKHATFFAAHADFVLPTGQIDRSVICFR